MLTLPRDTSLLSVTQHSPDGLCHCDTFPCPFLLFRDRHSCLALSFISLSPAVLSPSSQHVLPRPQLQNEGPVQSNPPSSGHLPELHSAQPMPTTHASHSDAPCALVHVITLSPNNALARSNNESRRTQPLSSQSQTPSKETHTAVT